MRNRERFTVIALMLCLLFLVTLPAVAQYGASVQGTVTDKSGAVVPGATVTVTNQATGVVSSTKTTEAGFYRIAALPPGLYNVEVNASTFKKTTAKDVEVKAEAVRGLNLTVEVGGTQEKVEVTGETVGVQTENANLTTGISTEQIQRLPSYGRDPYELLKLTPNVFGDNARAGNGTANWFPNQPGPGKGDTSGIFNQENFVQATANGQRPSSNNFMIDGTSVNSLTWGGASIITPNQESIDQITVTTSTYSAEDGRNAGAQVKVVSKSGTNVLHGSGFFKYDEPGLNAYNRWGGPDPGETPQRVNFKGRQFGGSVGGPILKNKFFFFFSYEGNRANSQSYSTQYIETAQFDQWVASNRPGTPVALVLGTGNNTPRVAQLLPSLCSDLQGYAAPGGNPYCQVVNGGLDIGSPIGAYGTYAPFFNGDTRGSGLDGIPDLQKAQILMPVTSRGHQFNLRFDYVRGNDTIGFSSYYVPRNDVTATNSGRPSEDLAFQPRNRYGAIIWNHTFSATLLNEFRFNATRQQNNQYASNTNVYWGLPAFEVEQIPFARIKWGPSEGTNSPLMMAQNQFEYRDTLSKNMGRHLLKFGGSLVFNQDNNDYEFGGARPVYVFHGIWNLANGAPIYEGFQGDPLTGKPTDDHKYYRQHDWALFIQDDLKLRPNLTVNIGLRYENFAPLNEKFGRQANLILGSGANALTNAVLQTTNPLYPADYNNFAPRIGFAWSPGMFKDKTVVRGGFGVSYNRITDTMTAISRRNPPYMFAYGLCCGTAANEWGTPFVNGTIDLNVIGNDLKSIYNYGANPALVNNFNPANGLPLNGSVEIWGASQNNRTPYTDNYSLEIEHELPHEMTATIGYAGAISRKLFRIVNENNIYQPNPAAFAVYFPTTDATSNYNALNASIRKRFSGGLQFNANYRWAKSLDTVTGEGACACTNQFYPPDQKYDYGPSDFDTKHNFVATTLYDLPIFKGRNDFLGKAFGGWHIDGTFQFHTGFPWSAVTGQCLPIPASGANICPSLPSSYNGKALTDGSNSTFMSPNGNFPLMHSAGGASNYFVLGGGPPLMHRNAFRGPHFQTIDMALAKATKFRLSSDREGVLDFRANFYNLFNKLNLSPFQYNDINTNIDNTTHFGEATGALAGRVVDFQMRFTF